MAGEPEVKPVSEPKAPEPVADASKASEPVAEPARAPEPARAQESGKKRIEVDAEEFEGMKTRLAEMDRRSKKTPVSEAPKQRTRAIDRLHKGLFGR